MFCKTKAKSPTVVPHTLTKVQVQKQTSVSCGQQQLAVYLYKISLI